jgi:hypothetical protein
MFRFQNGVGGERLPDGDWPGVPEPNPQRCPLGRRWSTPQQPMRPEVEGSRPLRGGTTWLLTKIIHALTQVTPRVLSPPTDTQWTLGVESMTSGNTRQSGS